MQTQTFKIAIPEDRQISLDLPEDVPPGPAEILVVVQHQTVAESALPTIADLGWSQEEAAAIRTKLATFTEDWDDPRMDASNDL